MKVLADASLPGLEQAFPKPFCLTLYTQADEITSLLAEQDVLLCRANLKVNCDLLKKHQLRYVATASSGSDHLDKQWLASQHIQVIDAKGCNARAVADYVVSCLAYLQQQQLIQGNHAGIIGFGEVGTRVQARLEAAGFATTVYDPLKGLNTQLKELHHVDLLCIHAELHDAQPHPSRNLIDQQFLRHLKSGCVIINAARGGIVDEPALLNLGDKFIYCTDVYLDEPNVNQDIIEKATLCTPHIAGHSLEAKYRAVTMVSEVLHQIAGLPLPKFAHPTLGELRHLDPNKTWQEQILSVYNPFAETMRLKQAKNLEETFLQLRKNHQKRHDFQLYAHAGLDMQTTALLGCSVPTL
ncbi:NAD(P)-dependent oxidoreductase [Legionella saoudiensis]|uniref:NAD(P)-dependent oxidoreductase n=1 Tax=Legionella saoudiensis TaxID=1750561 RepID=UPI000731D60E|nr:NAD(P)-dependent oxidoreductase [Legionella saoudiensis]